MIARLVAVMLITLPSVAAAQNRDLPLGLDLNGFWELEERGELLSNARAIVTIRHTSAGFVYAEFISGAECFNGLARPYAFVGQLSFPVPGRAELSAPTMFVCSGSASAVKNCGGSIPAMYASKFANVPVEADLNTGKPSVISGQRFAQGYEDCKPDSRYDGTHTFILRRVTCPVEERRLADSEKELRALRESLVTARPIFSAAINAARQRFGPAYAGKPIDVLNYPDQLLNIDPVLFEIEALLAVLPDAVSSGDWPAARLMASEMGLLATPPLVEAQRMLEEIYRIESMVPVAERALRDFKSARDALRKCRQQ